MVRITVSWASSSLAVPNLRRGGRIVGQIAVGRDCGSKSLWVDIAVVRVVQHNDRSPKRGVGGRGGREGREELWAKRCGSKFLVNIAVGQNRCGSRWYNQG